MPSNSTKELADAIVAAINTANKQKENVNSDEAGAVAVQLDRKVQEKALNQQNYANRMNYELEHNINVTEVLVPALYAEYCPTFTIGINGCTVSVKADGNVHKLNNDFAVILLKRMKALDVKVANMKKFDNREITR